MPRDDLTAAAASGDRLKTLEALRARLAGAIEVCADGKELASLALRLQMVLRDIAELGGKADKGEADDLAARRRAKLSAAADA